MSKVLQYIRKEMIQMIDLQIQIFLLIVVGFVLAKKDMLTKDTRAQLTNMILMLFLPCSIVKSFQMNLTMEMLVSSMYVLGISIGIQVLYMFINKTIYQKMDTKRKVCCQYATLASNAGFMGMPIAQGVFGDAGLLYASIFLLPQRICMYSSGISLFAKTKDKNVLLKVISHPCVFSIFIGIILMLLRMKGIYLPNAIHQTISVLGGCSSALSMIVVGSILASIDYKNVVDNDVSLYTLMRLIIIPLIILFVLRCLHIETLATNLSVLLSAMPAASTTAMLAQKYEGDYEFASKIVFVSTIASMITLPIITMIFSTF